MSGIHFASATNAGKRGAGLEKLREALVAPPVYEAKNPISDHLWTAIRFPVADLTARQYVNRKVEREFECFSYYCDDSYVRAYCAAHGDSYMATLGIQFVRILVKVCNQLAPALERRPRTNRPKKKGPVLKRDPVLASLIEGDVEVSEAEALAIVSAWPAANTRGAQIELGGYTLFYDLVRLIWLHEWAHALFGHVGFTSQKLGLAQLHEFSTDRVGEEIVSGLRYPKYEVLQSLEIDADEFATRYCVSQLLWGYDPIGQMAGPTVDLVDRLLFFNIACCVFAVIWSRAEQRYSSRMTYYPPFKTSHPPAALRYLRFRDFERHLATQYSMQSAPTLSPLVDAWSVLFLDRMGSVNQDFRDLLHETQGGLTTPSMERLDAYQARLLEVGGALQPYLTAFAFDPSYDPPEDLIHLLALRSEES